MSNKRVYEIDLEVSGLINNYKKALQVMKSSGASDKTLAPLEKSLSSIEAELLRLQKAGRDGIVGDPSTLKAYEREVQNAYKKLEKLGDTFSVLASDSKKFNDATKIAEKNLKEIQKQSAQAQKALAKTFEDLGFDKERAEALSNEIKNQTQLKELLKDERVIRKEIRKEAKAAYDAGVESYSRQAAARFGSNFIGPTTKSAATVTPAATAAINEYAENHGKSATEIYQRMNRQLANMVAHGEDFQTIWAKIEEFSQRYFNNLSTQQIFGNHATVVGKIETALAGRQSTIDRSAEAKALNAAQSGVDVLKTTDGGTDEMKAATAALKEYQQSVKDVRKAEEEKTRAEEQDAQQAQNLKNVTNSLSSSVRQNSQAHKSQTSALIETANTAKKTSESFAQLKSHILMFFSVTSVISIFRQQIRKTYEDVKNLDKSFASIAMVTSQSVSDMWASYEQYADMAIKLGQRTQSIIDASALFYQQGLDTSQALELTTETMKLATLAGIDYAQATDEMTAAIRGFRMDMDEGARVTDVYSTLAANAAASVNDIAQAMVRTSSIANSAGMSFENTAAFLTQMIETTQESAENIGTSMKTIIARFTELKENVAGTDESEFEDLDLNNVDKALKSVGVALKDTTGQFRDLDDVFMDLSSIWSALDRNTQRYVATIAAGSRQQSRFLALMDGYERNVELMEIAADSTGQADKQFEKYSNTMEYSLNKLATQWEKLRQSILSVDVFNDLITKGTDILDKIIDMNLTPGKVAMIIPFAALMAKTFIKAFTDNLSNAGQGFQGLFNSLASTVSQKVGQKVNELGEFSFSNNEINKLQQNYQNRIENYKKFIDQEKQLKTLAKQSEDEQQAELQETNTKIRSVTAELEAQKRIYDELARKQTTRQDVINDRANNNAKTRSKAQRSYNRDQPKLEQLDESLRQKQEELDFLVERRALKEDLINTYKEQQEQHDNNIIVEEEEIRRVLEEQSNIQASQVSTLIDRLGGLKTVITGVGQGIQQASSSIGMMVTMLASGASAVDTFSAGFKMLTAMAISQVGSLIPQILSAAAAQHAATVKQTAAEAKEVVAKKAAILATEGKISATQAETVAEIADTAATDADTAAKAANAAMTAVATAGISLLVVALMAAVAWIAKSITEEKAKAEADRQAASAAGQLAKATSDYEAAMQTLGPRYDEQKKKMDEAEDGYKKLQKAQEDYAAKILTDEQQEEWIQLQQELVELYPQLLSYYDEEGNAIVDITRLWEAAVNAKKDYYNTRMDTAKIAFAGAHEEKKKAKRSQNAIEDIDFSVQGTVDQKAPGSDTKAVFTSGYENPRSAPLSVAKRIVPGGGLLSAGDVEKSVTVMVAKNYKDWLKYNYEGLDAEQADSLLSLYRQILIDLNQAEFEDLKEPEEIFDKIIEKQQDSDWVDDVWSDVQDRLRDKNLEGQIKSRYDNEAEQAQAKQDKAARDYISSVIGSIFIGTDMDDNNLIDLYTSQVWDLLEARNWELSDLETGDLDRLKNDIIALNLEGYTSEEKEALKEVQAETNSIYEQYQSLVEKLGDKDQLVLDFVQTHESAFQSRTDMAKKLGELLGIDDIQIDALGDIIGDYENTIINFYKDLDEVQKAAFLDQFVGIQQKEDYTGQAEDYYNNLIEAFSKYNLSGEALGEALTFDFSQMNDVNAAQIKREFISKILSADADLEEEDAANLFDDVSEAVKDNANLFKFTSPIKATYDALIEESDAVTDVLESHAKTLAKYSGSAKSIFSISEAAGGEIRKIIDDLTDPNKGKLNKSLFADVLDWEEESNQYTFDRAKFNNIIRENSSDILEAAMQTNFYDEKDQAALQEKSYLLDLILGKYRSIEDTISGFENLTSSFTSAAQDQIKNGYVSAKNIQSLLDNTNNLGLDSEKMAGFFNDSLQFDYEGAYAYIDAQIKILEADSNMANANQEQITVWKALKKELMMAKNELEEEAESTNKAAEAQKKYEDQLKTVEEKQRALNEALKEFNEFMYGESNRESGLDKLYNYEQHLEHFNNEISRSKDILSDAETLEEATAALDRYSSATHDAIRYEKARAEAIREGLAAQEAQLNNYTYSYSNPEGGPVANVRFSDYIRKDSTGLYSIDQTLVDRAKFNDKFKQLLEQQVDDYNKYAEELLKSEDNVRKMEKEFQEQRAAAVKAYASMEKNIAEALKNNYQEEVDALKEKYDSMKEADDDYLDALSDAIEKQRKLREKESKYTDLSKKEKKLSLISRDTSGAQELQRRQLEQEIEKDRESLLDEAIDEVIDGMKELYEQQEENREVEIELKEALLENTGFWYSQAEGFAASFETAEDYMELMARLDKDFAESTLAMREDQLNTWRDEYQGAIQYTAMQAMDATSETGDFIVDTINVTGEEVRATVAETSDAYASEVITAYNRVTEEFQLDMQKQVQSIQSARDALAEAITKLQEYAAEARKAAEAYNVKPGDITDPGTSDIPTSPIPSDIEIQKEAIDTTGIDFQTTDGKLKLIKLANDLLGLNIPVDHISKMQIKTWLDQHYNDEGMQSKMNTVARQLGLLPDAAPMPDAGTLKHLLQEEINKYESGGLVDYTGPAWVDGTKSAPEAFLNPEDTRRIGEAARILADLPIFNSYGETTENISNSSGDISIEINLNIDKISSETDIDEMLDRVKEEIVSTARSVGTNTILQQ